eukprot:4684455-Pyramimonas_sp.AAC.1
MAGLVGQQAVGAQARSLSPGCAVCVRAVHVMGELAAPPSATTRVHSPLEVLTHPLLNGPGRLTLSHPRRTRADL